MAKNKGWRARLRYEFDKSMAAGPVALIGWLTIVTFFTILFVSLFVIAANIHAADAGPLDFFEAFWETLMRTMDPGNVGGDTGWPFRIVMLAVTLFGIIVYSSLIGVLAAGLNQRLAELRKGRSQVLETGHTVILNWSPSIFDVISELVIANANRRDGCIVIMAQKDKIAMEDEIGAKIADLRSTRVICRRGDPTDLSDLAIVSPAEAKSVIVLSPESGNPDAQVIKTVLSLVHDPRRDGGRYRIAAEIREAKNVEVARVVGGSEVQTIQADALISRIIVHSSRQAGLSAVYQELLDFEGCELYTAARPELTGKTFGEALALYETSCLVGLCSPDGRAQLNPPMQTIVGEGWKAILIAEDDDTIVAGEPGAAEDDAIHAHRPQARLPERTLILGWNRRGVTIASELARYVAPHSLLTIAADTAASARDAAALAKTGGNLGIEYRHADTDERATLEALDAPSYDHVIVLGYSEDMPPQAADTRTLVTLLHLRKIAEGGGKRISVVSEIADVRNRELAEVTRADDFVVSNRLVSLMLAQASEGDGIASIFDELLDERGSEIYMRPVSDYAAIDRPLDFYTLTEAARRRGEVALGYRRLNAAGVDARRMSGVTVNPVKSAAVSFHHEDRLIVLARD